MEYSNYLFVKLVVFAIAAGNYGFWRGRHGLPLEKTEKELQHERDKSGNC